MSTIDRREGVRGVTYRARVKARGRVRVRSFKRLGDARRWATDTEAALSNGKAVPDSTQMRRTVGDVIDRYLDETLPTKAHNKDSRNPPRLLKWWKKKAGDVPLVDLDADVIGKAFLSLSRGLTKHGKARTPGTCNRYLVALSAALAEAVRWQWIDTNPAGRVRKLQEPKGRTRFLSDDERRALLAACTADKNPDIYDFVMLAICTGARRGELMNLTWPCVDLKASPPRVTFADTKNDDARTVPVVGPALDILEARSKVRRIDNPHVFPGQRKGKPLDPRAPFDRCVEAAGVKDFRLHDLRHTAASYLAMNGATLPELADILGHRTLAMIKRYSHLTHQHTAGVLERMTARLRE